MKTVKIGLLGLGNIGTGTYKTLEMNREEIESTLNAKVDIVKILERDTERDRGIDVPVGKFTQAVSYTHLVWSWRCLSLFLPPAFLCW